MSNLTISECRDLLDRDLSFRTSTGDVGSDLFDDFINEIEDIYFDLDIQANPKKYLTATAISTALNPTPLATAYDMDVMGAGIFEANSDGTISDVPTHKTNRGSSVSGYFIDEQTDEDGANVVWTPPSIAAAVKWAVFVPYRTVKAADGTTTTLFPSRKAAFIKRALLRYWSLWNRGKDGMLAASDAEFISQLKNAIYNSAVQKESASLDLQSF